MMGVVVDDVLCGLDPRRFAISRLEFPQTKLWGVKVQDRSKM